MKRFLTTKWIVFFVLIVLVSAFVVYKTTKEETPDWVTGTVERGDVRELVSVSGVIEAEGEATLSFPTQGVVEEILVREGDVVVTDQVLATLKQDALLAERQDAYAALMIARADRDELIAGPRSEERDVTDAEIAIARANLERTITEEAQKVGNAYRALLSGNLEALPEDASTDDTPPTVSGTYTCATGGTYTVDVFRSSAQSGYSYRIGGIETGTYAAYTESPGAFGTCGLSLEFSPDEAYGNRRWLIAIPNTRGVSYTTNWNAYLLAKEQEANAVSAAREALDKALREQTLENAVPRDEALARAEAAILQAESRLAETDARLKDRTLRAPFAGVVSDIDITRGEVSTESGITLVASDIFELTVRIPEIDITRVKEGQVADVEFDARQGEIIQASIRFISAVAREIDGVAYFEAKLSFTSPPEWMRSGLNADVDIIVNEVKDTLRVAKRFIKNTDGANYLLYPLGTVTREEKVDVTFTGNDGFVAVSGNVREGDTIVLP